MPTHSNLAAGSYSIDFEADERYSIDWSLDVKSNNPIPGGGVIIGAANLSTTKVTVAGWVITTVSKSADKLIWGTLLPLCRDTFETSVKGTLQLVLGGGYVELEGWVTNFITDRDAPEGEEMIHISFDFFLSTTPDHSNLS